MLRAAAPTRKTGGVAADADVASRAIATSATAIDFAPTILPAGTLAPAVGRGARPGGPRVADPRSSGRRWLREGPPLTADPRATLTASVAESRRTRLPAPVVREARRHAVIPEQDERRVVAGRVAGHLVVL